jgi:PTS system galactitol-specific IIC component
VHILTQVVDFIFSFKAYVMLPTVILVVALALRMKVGQSLYSALRLGVGFAGIFIAFDFFVQQIAPAVTAIVKTRGLDFPVLDVGWPPLAAITWASPIAPLTIVLVLALNLAMLALNLTRTINIDIWNYWHFALVGALVQAASGSLLLGLAATALIAVYGIVVADWNAPLVRRECGLEGISITTLSVNGLLPYGVAANALIDRIPGVRRISLSPRQAGSRFGILVEPMLIGVAVGAFFAILAGYDVKRILELAINVAAVMFILPHCGGLIGKGMEPVSLQLKAIIQRRFPKKKVLYIGMDSGVIMQNSAVIVTGLLLMPISIGIAFILPGNRTLPLGDLANLISVMSVIVLATRGNVFRGVLIGIPIVAAYLLISTHFAPLYTTLAAQAGSASVQSYAGEITAFTDGGNPVRLWFYYLFRGNIWALVAIPAVLALMYMCWRNDRRLTQEDTP